MRFLSEAVLKEQKLKTVYMKIPIIVALKCLSLPAVYGDDERSTLFTNVPPNLYTSTYVVI